MATAVSRSHEDIPSTFLGADFMDRVRSRSIQYVIAPGRHFTYGVNTLKQGIHKTVDLGVETTEDSVTPGYFKQAREGLLLPVNEFVNVKREIYDVTSGTTTFKQLRNTTCQTYAELSHELSGPLALTSEAIQYGFLSPTLFSSSWLAKCPDAGPHLNEVLIEALAKVKTRDLDLGTLLAELHKTVGMVVHARTSTLKRARRVADALRSRLRTQRKLPRTVAGRARKDTVLRRKTGRIHQSFLDAFSESWLEDRYGWRILAMELEDAYLALKRLDTLVVGSPLRRATSERLLSTTVNKLTQNFRYVSIYTASGTFNSGIPPFTRVVTDTAQTHVRAGVGFQFTQDSVFFVDPLVTLYEVTPYSFVADWFLNVGDLLSAFTPFIQGEVLFAWTTVTNRCERSASWTAMTQCPQAGIKYPAVYKSGTPSFHASVAWRRVHRVPSDGPTPAIGFRLNFDWLKAIDAVTLLRQLTKRMPFVRI
jgi:hypothetical protein